MGVEVQWGDPEQTLIRIDMLGRWTWDEFYRAAEEIKLMITSKSTVVNMIAVVENPLHVPGNPLFQINNFLHSAPPNLGMTMIVGAMSVLSTNASTPATLSMRTSVTGAPVPPRRGKRWPAPLMRSDQI